jgi:D-alanine transfer protein
VNPGSPVRRPHLTAAIAALGVACIVLASGLVRCRSVEARYVHRLATDFSDAKLQGVALQKAAFAEDDLLLLYGSSELLKDIPNKASDFFYDYPTGFRVFPVGKPGTTALAVMQKIAALGPAVHGRKVAISLSPSSYFAEGVDPGYYAGNFSEAQATQIIFGEDISHELKRDTARRMLAYPRTIEDEWILHFGVARLARDTMLDRLLFAAILPLGRLDAWIDRVQDHFVAADYIDDLKLREEEATPRSIRKLNWDEILKRAEVVAKAMRAKAKKAPAPALVRHPHGSEDKAFLRTLAEADEWTDFELLLRVLDELGAKPLILSMPVHGQDLEAMGVSADARHAYLARLHDLTARHRVPLVYYQQEEDDPNFFYDNLDHLGAKGWIFYNKTLDDFYHDRLTTNL